MNTIDSVLYRITRLAVTAMIFFTCLAPSNARADAAGLLIGRGSNNSYNYVPSVIMHADGMQKMWWCAGPGPRDTILYRAINANTQQLITSTTKVLSEGAVGSWDSVFTCDPSVVMGNFSYPDGNGDRYTYAMYYTGTDNSTNGGINNGIGVAYSNDGITWRKWPFPILRVSTSEYGIGEQSVISADGQSAVWIFALQRTSPGIQHYHLYYSPDGVHLQYQFQVSEAGVLGNFLTQADFAYDYSTGSLYMVTDRINDEGTLDVYKMPWSTLSNGTWERVASMGRNGSYKPTPASNLFNAGAGFMRNEFGNNSLWLPNIQVFFGSGPDKQQTELWWWQTTGN